MPRLLLPLLLGLPAPAAAQMSETDLTFPSEGGQAVVATLALPDGDPAPVILLLHGFTGSRDELPIPGTEEGVFSRTARLLSEAGFASLRIDFRGSGESMADLAFADTTLEGQTADGLAALTFLHDEPRVNGEAPFVIGWSQGGTVATAVAGRSGTPRAVALWAAAADLPGVLTTILGPEAMAAGRAATEPVAFVLPWGAEIALDRPYFDSIDRFDPPAEIARLSRPAPRDPGHRGRYRRPGQCRCADRGA